MDAIKKKMQSLKTETDNSIARAEQLDAEAREANTRAEKTEENVSKIKEDYRNGIIYWQIFLPRHFCQNFEVLLLLNGLR